MFPGIHAETAPDRLAVVMTNSGETLTYAELDERANRLANLFRSLGLEPGDHVALCVENQARFFEVAWGAHYAGLVYTFTSTRLTGEELAYIVDDCGARVYIGSAVTREQSEAIIDATPNVEARFLIGGAAEGHQSYEEAVAAQSPEPLEERIAGIDMLYSSGTTGKPKGVESKFTRTPLETATGVTGLATMLLGYREEMRYLSPAPMYHAAPLRFSMGVHQVGGTVFLMERFAPEPALAAIEREAITHTQMVPTMFLRLLKLPEDVKARYDVSSVEMIVHAAAPCPVEAKRAMIDWFGPIIHEYYAGTEGNGFVYCNSESWLTHPGTVGQSLLGPLHICDDDGDEVPVGQPGTIWFESPTPFEYHNDPEKTAASRHPKGWTTLGDVGRLDEDGFLYLTDRQAYMIITGGVNVYPQETENLLAMHPAVADVAVFGVPDDDFGEAVKAVVELADGLQGSPELAAELTAYCREHLADVKCPRSIDFRGELPRHPTGKLYKRLLKDEYWAAAGRAI
ncbi:MAG: AMP-binding protein [Aquihabitans sp.]